MVRISTIIYYYSATGNSLYAARELQKALPGAELRSIATALQKGELSVRAECVGFVFPMHYFGLPLQVEEFLQKLTIQDSPYLFAVATCGVPYWGKPFLEMDAVLADKGQKLQGSWYLRLVSNYIPYRDIAAAWRIAIRAWLARRKLNRIAAAIKQRKDHTTWQLLQKFCERYHSKWKNNQRQIDETFQCNPEKCTSCGLCEQICPRGNILRPEGQPVWQHNCVECLGCLHICPSKAIDYGEITKGRQRYRHKTVQIADLLSKRG